MHKWMDVNVSLGGLSTSWAPSKKKAKSAEMRTIRLCAPGAQLAIKGGGRWGAAPQKIC